jgi:hypothetical protein
VRKGGPVCFFTAGSPAFDISLLLEALKRIQRMKQSQSHGVLKPRHNPQICRIECTGRRSLTLDDMVDRHEELAAVRWNGAVVGSPSNTQPASVNKLRAVASLRTNR